MGLWQTNHGGLGGLGVERGREGGWFGRVGGRFRGRVGWGGVGWGWGGVGWGGVAGGVWLKIKELGLRRC